MTSSSAQCISYMLRRVIGSDRRLGIVTGNPRVFQGNPYPHPRKPAPAPRVRVSTGSGKGFRKTRGYPTCSRVSSQNQPINLASAVRVSIDTAVQSCEVINLV
jgi:hypothetical protein